MVYRRLLCGSISISFPVPFGLFMAWGCPVPFFTDNVRSGRSRISRLLAALCSFLLFLPMPLLFFSLPLRSRIPRTHHYWVLLARRCARWCSMTRCMHVLRAWRFVPCWFFLLLLIWLWCLVQACHRVWPVLQISERIWHEIRIGTRSSGTAIVPISGRVTCRVGSLLLQRRQHLVCMPPVHRWQRHLFALWDRLPTSDPEILRPLSALLEGNPIGNQLLLHILVLHEVHLLIREPEHAVGHRLLIRRKACVYFSEIVKERVHASLESCWPCCGVVLENLGQPIHSLRRGARSEDLAPGIGLNLWELKFTIDGVHGLKLFASGRSKNLDDFHELINPTVSGKENLLKYQLGSHTGH
mmetsp:Transcript_32307/g.57154  ORF Transcript_32307/g.57154 Transcript_32307/m.57154 type:complete len:356 (-) Transcript_32307:981-2048(-)